MGGQVRSIRSTCTSVEGSAILQSRWGDEEMDEEDENSPTTLTEILADLDDDLFKPKEGPVDPREIRKIDQR